MSRPVGPNTKESVRYSRTGFKTICDRIAAGSSLRRACLEEGMPTPGAVTQWVMDDKDGCSIHYEKARRAQASHYADELLDIADDSSQDTIELKDGSVVQNKEFTARSRLRVDTRKWVLSKVLPKVYGEKLDLTHGGSVDINLSLTGISDLLARQKSENEGGGTPTDT